MTSNSSIGILQLVHTGRQSVRCAGRLPFNPPLAPSSIRISTNPNNYIGKIAERIVFQEPRTMNEQDIQHVIELFLKGAKLAYAAGFHGIELHASHGYLLSSFLSPKTNKRKDEYGGSTKARLQIIIEIIDCIRKEYKRPFVLGIKLNSTDYVEGGLTEEEALQHVEMLARHGGLDFIEVSQLSSLFISFIVKVVYVRFYPCQISGGSYENLAFLGDDTPSPPTTSRTQHREAIFSAFASRAKEVVLKATNNSNGEHSKDVAPLIMCTGGFRSKAGIEQALRGDGIDLIGIGRPAAADPDWTVRLLASATKSSRSEKTDEDQSSVEDRCVTYKVNGGRWLQTLVPLKIVGGGMMTLWHELQMSRLGRGEEAKVEWTFERLLVVEFLQSAKVPLYVTVAIALLAIVSVSQFR